MKLILCEGLDPELQFDRGTARHIEYMPAFETDHTATTLKAFQSGQKWHGSLQV